jgi:hypothetical protein
MNPYNDSASRVPTARADASADRSGRSVEIKPAPRRRLLELQAELEKSVGEKRVRVQREIDRWQNADTESQ